MEVRDLTIALIVVHCRGDPGLFLKDKKWPDSSDHDCIKAPFLRIFIYIDQNDVFLVVAGLHIIMVSISEDDKQAEQN